MPNPFPEKFLLDTHFRYLFINSIISNHAAINCVQFTPSRPTPYFVILPLSGPPDVAPHQQLPAAVGPGTDFFSPLLLPPTPTTGAPPVDLGRIPLCS